VAVTPSGPTPGSSRPPRRLLFLQAFVDVLLCLLPMLVALVGIPRSTARYLVNREDRWRFEAMPASEDALYVWSRSQLDLRNFRVQRVQADRELVLRYDRTRTKGPAHPDWDHLGYRMAYLVSAPSLENAAGMWLGVIVAYLAAGGVVGFRINRINRGLRVGAPLISPTERPRQGWLRWLLLALVILAAAYVAQGWLLRILHLEQKAQQPFLHLIRWTSGWPLLMAVTAVVLVGPICEELLFRGCVFGRFQAYGYGVSGAIVSALLFSVAHGVLALLPIFFCIGLILAWLCQRTGSLWPAMALSTV
jgi:membrane protease YdiL (CAAX protease family)